MEFRGGNTLTNATARSDLSGRLFHLSRHNPGFSQDDFSRWFKFNLSSYRFNSDCHVIDDNSLLCGSVMAETSRPSFKGFETEREWILSGLKATALKNIHFVSGKHVSGLKILHFKISILGGPDIFGTVIVPSIVLWLAIRYLNFLTL